MVIKIKGRLPALNEYTNAERRNRFIGAKVKKDAQDLVLWQIKNMEPITEPSFFWFEWHEKTLRRDPDNTDAFGRKVVMDALQVAEKLPDDNHKWVLGYAATFVKDDSDFVLIRISPYVILPS